MVNPDPVKPATLSRIAEATLEELAKHPESSEIVLGGGIALKHYVDFRETNDLDAWWRAARRDSTVEMIREVVGSVADAFAYRVEQRSFGSTESFECKSGVNKKVFSFQISPRDVTLDVPVASAWPPVMIETLRDNAGSKMNALVDRGAPRDLLDIHAIALRGLISIDECWLLWEEKNPHASTSEAAVKVLGHVERLEQRRPLRDVPIAERESAEMLRSWYRREFTASILGNPGV